MNFSQEKDQTNSQALPFGRIYFTMTTWFPAMSTDSLTLWTTVVVTITLSLAAKRLARAAWAPENSLQKTTPPSSTVATCCPICLEGINEAEECRLPCGHLFHETCLKRWFQADDVTPRGLKEWWLWMSGIIFGKFFTPSEPLKLLVQVRGWHFVITQVPTTKF